MAGGSATLLLNPSVDALQKPLVHTPDEIDSLSNVKQFRTYAIPQKVAEMQFVQGNGTAATAKFLYVVFNATSDADALTKLGIAGLRRVIPLGDARTFVFPALKLLTRMDFIVDVAETGISKLLINTGA